MINYSEVEERLFSLLKEHDQESRRGRALQLWQDVYIHRMQPVTIDNRALFLYYGEAQTVTLVGDWSFWQPNTTLKRIEYTNLFYAIVQFPPDARMQYKLIVDGNWTNDPANARVQAEGFGYNSEFWMPSYKDVSKLDIGREVPRGKVERLMFESTLLSSHREMFLYTPPSRNPVHNGAEGEYPLIVIHDGAEALRLGNFHRIMDNCIAEGLIPPVLALFISPQWRNEEYATNDSYLKFTAEEALPFAIEQFAKRGYTVTSDRMLRCVTGASLGGLLSTKTVLRYPDAFGSVISQSPSYWWNRGEVFRSPDIRNAHRIHFVIQTGTICDAKDLASLMANRLRSIGTKVDYFEYSQGHTWGNWRTTFAEGIQSWLPNVAKEHALT